MVGREVGGKFVGYDRTTGQVSVVFTTGARDEAYREIERIFGEGDGRSIVATLKRTLEPPREAHHPLLPCSCCHPAQSPV